MSATLTESMMRRPPEPSPSQDDEIRTYVTSRIEDLCRRHLHDRERDAVPREHPRQVAAVRFVTDDDDVIGRDGESMRHRPQFFGIPAGYAAH